MVHIQMEVPKSMRDYSQSPEAREKPYNICLLCPAVGITCDGPNIMAMEYPRWVEWALRLMRDRKMTYAELALASGLSLPTVKSALSGKGYDVRTETMRAITRALIGGCWGQFPCHLAALLMEDQAHEVEPSTLSSAERERMEAQMAQVKADYQAKVDYLKERVLYLQEQVSHWQAECRLRDKHIADKNARIDNLLDRLLADR